MKKDTNSCFSGIAGLIVYAAGRSERALDLLSGRYAYYKTERLLIPIQIRRKWAVSKLGGSCSWPKKCPLSSGVISPSALNPKELVEIGPESNGPPEGCEQLQTLCQKGPIFEKLTLHTSNFLSFWSVKSCKSIRCDIAADVILLWGI